MVPGTLLYPPPPTQARVRQEGPTSAARLPRSSKKEQGKIKKAKGKEALGIFFINGSVYQTRMGRVRYEGCLVRSADGLVVLTFSSVSWARPSSAALRFIPSAFLLSSLLSVPYHLTEDSSNSMSSPQTPSLLPESWPITLQSSYPLCATLLCLVFFSVQTSLLLMLDVNPAVPSCLPQEHTGYRLIQTQRPCLFNSYSVLHACRASLPPSCNYSAFIQSL